jgi:hypothetical protein
MGIEENHAARAKLQPDDSSPDAHQNARKGPRTFVSLRVQSFDAGSASVAAKTGTVVEQYRLPREGRLIAAKPRDPGPGKGYDSGCTPAPSAYVPLTPQPRQPLTEQRHGQAYCPPACRPRGAQQHLSIKPYK